MVTSFWGKVREPDKQRCLNQTQSQPGNHVCYNYQYITPQHPSLQAQRKQESNMYVVPSSICFMFFFLYIPQTFLCSVFKKSVWVKDNTELVVLTHFLILLV